MWPFYNIRAVEIIWAVPSILQKRIWEGTGARRHPRSKRAGMVNSKHLPSLHSEECGHWQSLQKQSFRILFFLYKKQKQKKCKDLKFSIMMKHKVVKAIKLISLHFWWPLQIKFYNFISDWIKFVVLIFLYNILKPSLIWPSA